MISAYLINIPKKADKIIQKTAPAPPNEIALETPIIFPVPTVEAREVIAALKEVKSDFEQRFDLIDEKSSEKDLKSPFI